MSSKNKPISIRKVNNNFTYICLFKVICMGGFATQWLLLPELVVGGSVSGNNCSSSVLGRSLAGEMEQALVRITMLVHQTVLNPALFGGLQVLSFKQCFAITLKCDITLAEDRLGGHVRGGAQWGNYARTPSLQGEARPYLTSSAFATVVQNFGRLGRSGRSWGGWPFKCLYIWYCIYYLSNHI